MQRFFDGPEDMAAHVKIAQSQLLPFIDMMDAQYDPANHVKLQTALFIIFTDRAIRRHGLTKNRAYAIIDAIFDVHET